MRGRWEHTCAGCYQKMRPDDLTDYCDNCDKVRSEEYVAEETKKSELSDILLGLVSGKNLEEVRDSLIDFLDEYYKGE